MKYLYGADVKKIQTYISDSSKLKEIAGASELVECVCTDLFDEFSGKTGDTIIAAAGKIRAVFDHREDVERLMLGFPKTVGEKAEGLQLVQSVVELPENEVCKKDADELEKRLAQEMPMVSARKDWSFVDKAPRSGHPVYQYDGGEKNDLAAVQKRNAVDRHWKELRKRFGVWKFPSDNTELAGTDSFIAVIHADGNSLGQKLMKLPDGPEFGQRWKAFSQELDAATAAAAKRAYESSADKKFRPIILGGDDLTVVCSADSAIDFTRSYLEAFREETGKRDVLGELTACAGIAFIKDSYPFHFGLELAEQLCKAAKKRAKALDKERVPSCLMFTLELGSFVEADFDDIRKRRLTAGSAGLDFGPYKTSGNAPLPDVADLIAAAGIIAKCNPLKTGIRRFVSELSVNSASAAFLARRVQQVAAEKHGKVLLEFMEALGALTGRSGTLDELLLRPEPPCGETRKTQRRNTPETRTPALDLLVLAKFVNSKKEDGENE